MLTACNVQLSDLLTSSCCHTALSLIVEHREVIWTIKNPAPAIHKSFLRKMCLGNGLSHAEQEAGSVCVYVCGNAVNVVTEQVLVMAPTRELAKQVSDTFKMFAASDLSVLSVYGGTPIYPQGLLCLLFDAILYLVQHQ